MVETVNYQCPACGGPLHFSGETGNLVCDYCDSTFTVKQVEDLYAAKQEKAESKAEKEKQRAQKAEGADANGTAGVAAGTAEAAAAGAAGAAGVSDNVVAAGAAQAAKAAEEGLDPIQAYLKRSNWNDAESETLATSVCSSCGAELIHDQTTAVAQCPYCGNNTVIPGTMAGTLKPDYVIPFKIDKKAAKEALQRHYRGKKLLPKIFKKENHIDEIKGVYVPFWLFDADADADIRYKATRVRTWSDSDYDYTETSYYSIGRSGDIGFDRVPVDGSSKMPDDLMESIEPFKFEDAVDFKTAYLAGYLADKYDVTAEQSIDRANERIKRSTEDAFASTVEGYHSVTTENSSIRLHNGKAKYALYPVWLLNTTWKGKKYLFAMNGQTGKFVGDLPVDNGLYFKWLSGLTAGFGVIALIAYFLFWLF